MRTNAGQTDEGSNAEPPEQQAATTELIVPPEFTAQRISYMVGVLDAKRGSSPQPDAARFGQAAADAYQAGYQASAEGRASCARHLTQE